MDLVVESQREAVSFYFNLLFSNSILKKICLDFSKKSRGIGDIFKTVAV
jgi:hypothetical protein